MTLNTKLMLYYPPIMHSEIQLVQTFITHWSDYKYKTTGMILNRYVLNSKFENKK